ncbi:rab gdp/gtp exchange factor [Anaeramoeba ignava]|uniref:Rab gdp/gtp exchange factor n=1 Tax=Anaeramoeba ignava TaxID=1746090 RepID=A0A9Q0LJV1_ANAIG|nr:rab gdp/gtp exchange factor [Anaeramoeba ignava]
MNEKKKKQKIRLEKERIKIDNYFTVLENYDNFHKFLKTQSQEIKNKIQLFAKNFDRNQQKLENIQKYINEFTTKISDEFFAFITQKNLKRKLSKTNKKQITENFHIYILKKLYNKIFFLNGDEDVFADQKLFQHLEKFSFIQFKHLRIPHKFYNPEKIEKSMDIIQEINLFKTPNEKMRIVSEFVQNIKSILQENDPHLNYFFPLISYIVLHANIPNFKSNIQFIQRFSDQEILTKNQKGIHFSYVVSTVDFLENLASSDLDIDPKVFNYLVYGNKPKNSQIQKEPKKKSSETNSIENEEVKNVKNSETNSNDQNLIKFHFLNANLEDLLVSQVQVLFLEYKQLIQENINLRKKLSEEFKEKNSN